MEKDSACIDDNMKSSDSAPPSALQMNHDFQEELQPTEARRINGDVASSAVDLDHVLSGCLVSSGGSMITSDLTSEVLPLSQASATGDVTAHSAAIVLGKDPPNSCATETIGMEKDSACIDDNMKSSDSAPPSALQMNHDFQEELQPNEVRRINGDVASSAVDLDHVLSG